MSEHPAVFTSPAHVACSVYSGHFHVVFSCHVYCTRGKIVLGQSDSHAMEIKSLATLQMCFKTKSGPDILWMDRAPNLLSFQGVPSPPS